MLNRLQAFTIVTLGVVNEALAQATPPADALTRCSCTNRWRFLLAVDHHRLGDHCRYHLVLHARALTGCDNRHFGNLWDTHQPHKRVRQR